MTVRKLTLLVIATHSNGDEEIKSLQIELVKSPFKDSDNAAFWLSGVMNRFFYATKKLLQGAGYSVKEK